jgi:hypothetical protein
VSGLHIKEAEVAAQEELAEAAQQKIEALNRGKNFEAKNGGARSGNPPDRKSECTAFTKTLKLTRIVRGVALRRRGRNGFDTSSGAPLNRSEGVDHAPALFMLWNYDPKFRCQLHKIGQTE